VVLTQLAAYAATATLRHRQTATGPAAAGHRRLPSLPQLTEDGGQDDRQDGMQSDAAPVLLLRHFCRRFFGTGFSTLMIDFNVSNIGVIMPAPPS